MKHNTRKYTIQVRRYLPGQSHYGSPRLAPITGDAGTHIVTETIRRALRAEQIGNFSPLFCRYAGNPRVLVHSDAGDLSDPFRREEGYAASLFIVGEQLTTAEVQSLKSAGLL